MIRAEKPKTLRTIAISALLAAAVFRPLNPWGSAARRIRCWKYLRGSLADQPLDVVEFERPFSIGSVRMQSTLSCLHVEELKRLWYNGMLQG